MYDIFPPMYILYYNSYVSAARSDFNSGKLDIVIFLKDALILKK